MSCAPSLTEKIILFLWNYEDICFYEYKAPTTKNTQEFKLKNQQSLVFLYKSQNSSFITHTQALINLITELLHSWVSWVDFTLLLKLDLSFCKQRSQETIFQHNPLFLWKHICLFISSTLQPITTFLEKQSIQYQILQKLSFCSSF